VTRLQTPRSIARLLRNTVPEIRTRCWNPSETNFYLVRLMAEMDGRYLSLAVWRNRAARELQANAPVM
jgi:hypothetical protein